ncbi:MAG: DNA polymerase Pol2 [Candidatus Parvarchaeum acidophilus ARMAN-5]|uniref:DNA-directed DNA polymerase n=1 Tax=Candidatus Parvarchaeum acidophilus ARMAN-5 TaxID=662762 RepID=D6GUG5_PARA5|nr:MAG: DNA polymerase Pol2 [Candidatus Parvarchaeum acidophilus ARMAN-5]
MAEEYFLVDADYTVIDGSPVIRLFCVNIDSELRIFYDNTFKPYCYVDTDIDSFSKTIGGLSFVDHFEKVEKYNLGKKSEVIKVYTKLPEDIPKIKQTGLSTYEADIPFYKRYLLDKDIGSHSILEIERNGDYIKKISSKGVGEFPIRAAALDIETYTKRAFPNAKVDPILAVSIVSSKESKCITWLDAEGENIIKAKDEKDLLLKLSEYLSSNKFNVIIGYNSDSFDMPYIHERSRILGVDFRLNGFELKIKGEKRKVAEINGIAHIDILNFIRHIYSIYNLKTETLTLRAVASELIGDKKGEFDWDKITEVFNNRELASTLCSYCVQDSKITLDIFYAVLPLLAELNKLVGQTLSDISRMTTGAVVENLVMKKALAINELIPNKPSDFQINDRMHKVNTGAFVFQPTPGLYENIAVVDFRSLYPSIIVSHNICPSTIKYVGGKAEFLDKKERVGLIPAVLNEVIRLRFDAKDRLKIEKDNSRLKARVLVLKLIANGFYGNLGYYNSRWYCFDCAGATTALGRQYVQQVISSAQNVGFKVLYADTDSAFFEFGVEKDKVNSFISDINSSLPKPMELELQDFYLRAIFVSAKGGIGAKKKYAMVDFNGNLLIKGFQSVRRDWAIIAKNLQKEVLKKILVDNDIEGAMGLVKNTIKTIKEGNANMEDLAILTRLRKDPSSYTQTSRHISAVEKSGMKFSNGDTIKYIIAKGKDSDRVSDKAVLYDIARKNGIKYDPDYYINKQVLPSVLHIFEVLGYSDEDIVGRRDNSLSGFF